jgi:hypothetical protein
LTFQAEERKEQWPEESRKRMVFLKENSIRKGATGEGSDQEGYGRQLAVHSNHSGNSLRVQG